MREALKSLDINVNVKTLRTLLASKVNSAHFEINRDLYKYSYNTLKTLKPEISKMTKTFNMLNNKYKTLTKTAANAAKKSDRESALNIQKEREEIKDKLRSLNKEIQVRKSTFNKTKQIYNERKFMKGIQTFDQYKKSLLKSTYWADETAISILEYILNVKIIILSEEDYKNGSSLVIKCGATILPAIEKRNEFNPKYYILINHSGNHYKPISYNGQYIFNFYEIPYIVLENIKNICSKGKSLYSLIPLFKSYFSKK